jgi:archaellin
MKSWGSTGLTVLIVLIATMLVAITAASVISTETTSTTTEEDYQQMLEDAANEVSRYLLVKEQMGKFSDIDGEKQIEKIILWITPLVKQDIDMSQLTIELNNGESVMVLTYVGSNQRESSSIFEQSIWNSLDGNNFGLISIIDLDESLVNNDAFNDASDNAYLAFKLPTGMTMSKYDEMIVKLVPSSGIARTLYLKAPMPMKSIVEL